MNTYFLNKKQIFDELSNVEQQTVLDCLNDAIKENSLVTIRGEDITYGMETYATLYGIYTLSSDDVFNYISNGGQWSYLEPLPLLKEFTS